MMPKNGEEELDQDQEQSTIDSFVLEEYKNISKAHFELHNAFRQMFRFYLGIIAVPVTVFAFAYKDASVSVESLPTVFVYILLLTGIIGLLMFLSVVNIRFDIIFYTRTVNGTRAYFLDTAEGSGLKKYLMLPGNMRFPPYQETFKAYWWQFLMIALVNSTYIAIAFRNISGLWCFALLAAILVFGVHPLAYYRLAASRDGKDKERLAKMGITEHE
jgi:hypothetical protein